MAASSRKRSSLIDTGVIYCGDNLDQLKKLPDACVDLIYIDPPFNSNRNYEVFWGETKEKRAFEDRHESTQAYIEFMRPRCVEMARVLKKTGSFYYHCDWHASHYVKVMLDQTFGENFFQNEIVWRRTTAHGDTHGFGHIHDILFRYSNGAKPTFNVELKSYPQAYIDISSSRMNMSQLEASIGVRTSQGRDYATGKPEMFGAVSIPQKSAKVGIGCEHRLSLNDCTTMAGSIFLKVAESQNSNVTKGN
ncbi:MAG TPA: DNA methyltransferase [Candidatus Acidoferrales bacterium]|nr:DNA methyltransferase [Candidatus Acidoferrales bacterium]